MAGTEQESSHSRRKRKRGKSSAIIRTPIQRSTKPGKLSGVLEFPVEVVADIMSHLHVRDILHVSRTAKFFGRFLLSNNSTSRIIWQSALAESGAPLCPQGMHCSAYAALLFDPVCNECGGFTTCAPSMILRSRLCKACEPTVLTTPMDILNDPTRPHISHLTHLCSMVPYKEPIVEFDIVNNGGGISKTVLRTRFHKRTLRTIAEEYVAKSAVNRDEFDAFVKERRGEMTEREAQSSLVKRWFDQRKGETQSLNDGLTELFKVDMHKKLQIEGFQPRDIQSLENAEDDEIRDEWRMLTIAPKIMTNKIWDNSRPKLHALVARYHQYEDVKRRQRRHRIERVSTFEINGYEVWVDDTTRLARSIPAHVFVVDVNMLENNGIVDFLNSNEGNKAYDSLSITNFHDLVWAELLKRDIVPTIHRWRFRVEALSHLLLLEGVNRVDDFLLDPKYNASSTPPYGLLRVEPPSGFSVLYAAAFFKHDNNQLPGCCPRRESTHYPLFTFADVALSYGVSSSCLDELKAGEREVNLMVEEKKRMQMGSGGTNAVAHVEREFWIRWKRERQCGLEGSKRGVEIALVLLYGTTRCANYGVVFNVVPRLVTMQEMEAKRSVFVCMRCPEEGRVKRGWRDLVTHIYGEICRYEQALLWQGSSGEQSRLQPPINVHDHKTAFPLYGFWTWPQPGLSLLAVENGSYEDGVCPYDIDHEHPEPSIGSNDKPGYSCQICVAMGMQYSRRWRRCVETHLKARHGKLVIADRDITCKLEP